MSRDRYSDDWPELPEPQCGECGATPEAGLFFVPGGWGWSDDRQDGRLGLCAGCGQTVEKHRERFAQSFGNIVHVTDSDQAGARDLAT